MQSMRNQERASSIQFAIALVEYFISALILSNFRVWVLLVAMLVALAGAIALDVIVSWPALHTLAMLVVLIVSVEIGYLLGSRIRSALFDIRGKRASSHRSARSLQAVGSRHMTFRRQPLLSGPRSTRYGCNHARPSPEVDAIYELPT
jgi:hypothetical protein